VPYSCDPEVPENTPCHTSCYASVLDLCGAGVGVHLGELQLSLGADTLGQRSVADDVTEGLSDH
jgi:hypothetical protein